MVKPNFFIIGAPKSATSALQTYLSEHQSVYMVKPEEPNFYATEFRNPHNIGSEEEYLKRFFHGAKGSHVAVGEKSTWYLYSKNAVKNINDAYPDARYIAILRNPVELAYSLHSELLYTEQEDIEDFWEAWNAQEDRRNGRNIPKTLKIDHKMLLYSDVCRLGEQVKRVLNEVPSDKVMFVLYDDFRNDTRSVYKSVLSFLGVEDDNRESFDRVNQNKVIRSRFIDRMLKPDNFFVDIAGKVKETFGIKRLGIGGLLLKINYKFNTATPKRNSLPDEVKYELIEYFKDDINELSKLIGRNIDHWLK